MLIDILKKLELYRFELRIQDARYGKEDTHFQRIEFIYLDFVSNQTESKKTENMRARNGRNR